MKPFSRDVAAGAFLIGVAVLASWQGSELALGTLRQVGPGLVPRALAGLLGLFGLVLMLKGFKDKPEAVEEAAPGPWWSLRGRVLRGPVFLFIAVAAFGLGVRTVGLIVAGPLVVVLSALASSETRAKENALFALGMTLFCFLLFKQLLSLPIPLAPFVLGF
jgi:putative tricarboxylic transport membrane protein